MDQRIGSRLSDRIMQQEWIGVPDQIIKRSGKTVPFDMDTLATLYPDAGTYINAVKASAETAVNMGYLLPIDAATIIAEADR